MSQAFYQMQAEVAAIDDPKPPTRDIYLVAAYDAIGGAWSIRRQTSLQEFGSIEAAERFAGELDGRWRHRKIVKVSLEA